MTTFASPETLAAGARANVDSLLTLAKSVFASAERLAALNLNTARALFEDSAASTRVLMEAKDPKAALLLQAGLIKPAIEKALAYSKSVYEITTDTSGEFTRLVEGQLADVNKNVADVIAKASKSAPAGSEAAVTAVKNAIGATNAAIERLNKASKDATAAAEASVGAASAATLKAVTAVLVKLPA